MDKSTKYLLTVAIIAAIGLFIIAFFLGRASISYETEVRYVQGEVVRDTIFAPVPVLEIVHDTIYLVEHDTILTLIDWNTERYYTERLISDNSGILDVSASVQFNRIQDIRFEFIPIYKEITRYRVRLWQPYIGGSLNTFSQAAIGGGLFYKNTGIDIHYIYDLRLQKKGYGIGIKYRF